MDWIRVIDLLDLRLHRVVTWPHYRDTTDDGTLADLDERNKRRNQRTREPTKRGWKLRLRSIEKSIEKRGWLKGKSPRESKENYGRND
jgi:hypothetical protein